jgi:hypothetical protein
VKRGKLNMPLNARQLATILMMTMAFGTYVFGFQRKLDVVVTQGTNGICFQFFQTTSPRKPAEVFTVTVSAREDGVAESTEPEDTCWQIETSEQTNMTSRCEYGVIPVGFKQVIPAHGAPRRLEAGKTYHISCRGGGIGTAKFTIKAP